MANYPRILIGAPQSDKKRYCFDAWAENILNFSYPKENIDVFLVDNSDTPEFSEYIKSKYGFGCVHIPKRGRDIRLVMAQCHEAVRRQAIKGKYDYLLHLETDIFPPHDGLLDLIWSRKDIVSGLYHLYNAGARTLMIQQMENNPADVFKSIYSCLPESSCLFADGTTKEVYHAGLGVMLIRKNVLNKFSFRYEMGTDRHPDTFFATDINTFTNLKINVNTSVVCFHWNIDSWGNMFRFEIATEIKPKYEPTAN
jgi:hypothetical protein